MPNLVIPHLIAAAPTKYLRVGMEIDGQLRLIDGARAPTSTPPSTPQESFPYSLGSITQAGDETPGSISLVFVHHAGTDIDTALRTILAAAGTLKLNFRTKGAQTFDSDAGDKVDLIQRPQAGKYTGLSEVQGGQGALAPEWTVGTDVRVGSVIQINAAALVAAVVPNVVANDLIVISHIYYDDAGNGKLYTKNQAKTNDLSGIGPFEVHDQSIEWAVTGTLLSYNPGWDEGGVLSTIEVGVDGTISSGSKLIRSDAVDAPYTQ